MSINYFEKDGRLHFFYEEKESLGMGSYKMYETSGRVPAQKVREGPEAIRLYVEQRVEKEIRKQKREFAALKEHRRNYSFPVEVRHRGVLLKGKMSSSNARYLSVALEEPYEVHTGINYGWAAATARKFIYDQTDPLKFSEDAVATAKRLLIRAYDEEEHRRANQDIVNLTDELNEGRRVRPPLHLR